VDAYRLKRNFGYWLLSSHTETFDIFTEKSKAVVEHHFNNHIHCGDWCPMRKVTNATKTATGNLKYRCKKENAILYKQIIEIMGRFVKPEKLRECHHGYSSQKNESMNKLISRYTPKDRTFSQSTSLASRVCLAVGVDSVGQEEYFRLLFAKLKMKLPENTKLLLRKMKIKRDYDRKYQALPKRKRNRSAIKFRKMRTGLSKQMADKAIGLTYASGMNMGHNMDEVEGEGDKKRRKKAVICMHCGESTHKTRRSKACK
jgi:hypothetical protein